jgi:hypothetical protein
MIAATVDRNLRCKLWLSSVSARIRKAARMHFAYAFVAFVGTTHAVGATRSCRDFPMFEGGRTAVTLTRVVVCRSTCRMRSSIDGKEVVVIVFNIFVSVFVDGVGAIAVHSAFVDSGVTTGVVS